MIARQENGRSTTSERYAFAGFVVFVNVVIACHWPCRPCCAQEPAANSIDATNALKATKKSFHTAMAIAEKEYRHGLAKAVHAANRVEVFRIECDLDAAEVNKVAHGSGRFGNAEGEFTTSNPRFPIAPYEKQSPIYDTVTLTTDSDDWPMVLRAIEQSINRVEARTNALSHFPTHAVRVYAGNTLLFQTSYCFISDSFFIDYGRYSQWHDLHEGSLEQVCLRVMPLPPDYKRRLERFRPSGE